MIKNKIFKQGIGITEKKSQETRRDHWGGNVCKPQIPILTPLKFHMTGICGLHYHPSNPFLFFLVIFILCLKILFSRLCVFSLIHS